LAQLERGAEKLDQSISAKKHPSTDLESQEAD
jgi:hypothetical protein